MITIELYCGKYDEEIISLILGIQNGENKLGLTLEEQPDLKAIKESYSDKGGEFWTALDDGRLIGTIGLMMKPDGYAVLKKFFVHKDHRLQKVGLKLYLTLLDYAKEKGVRHIFLTPLPPQNSPTYFTKRQASAGSTFPSCPLITAFPTVIRQFTFLTYKQCPDCKDQLAVGVSFLSDSL